MKLFTVYNIDCDSIHRYVTVQLFFISPNFDNVELLSYNTNVYFHCSVKASVSQGIVRDSVC
jgi:hypothetical protein